MTNDDNPVLALRNISKQFGDVQALDGVDFDLREGEIHALLGENGAGKSTLMNILYGLYEKDDGEILINGECREIDSPQTAMSFGIGMVHQLFRQVHRHSVIENIALADPPTFFSPSSNVDERLRELMEQYDWILDTEAKISELSASDRQKVEILKALYQGARILILDEPTSVLTPQGKEKLFENLLTMKEQGFSIIFITHKLDEVQAISDRVTILRDGNLIGTYDTDNVDNKELAEMMVGREVLFDLDVQSVSTEEEVLTVRDMEVTNSQRQTALEDACFSIHEGEILGVAGIGGSGQSEMLDALMGLRPLQKGTVLLRGNDFTGASPLELIEAGIGYIPGERDEVALCPTLSNMENLVLKEYRNPSFRHMGLLQWNGIKDHTRDIIRQYNIKTPGPSARTEQMSGGNLQKLLLAREIESGPDVLLAAYPTHGLDVGTTEQIHQELLQQRESGMAILLVSEQLDHLQSLCDRIMVLFEGKIMGILDREDVTREKLGLLMMGQPQEDAA